MYFPQTGAHGVPGYYLQPQNEPLSYLQRARRVNILYDGHDARGSYLGVTNRFLPELPQDVTRRITGYTTRNGRRVNGVTEEELWKLNRKHGRTAFLVPIHAMRKEVRRLRNILMQPYSIAHLTFWGPGFANAHERLHELDDNLQQIIARANASSYHVGAFRNFKNELDADKLEAQALLHTLYRDVGRLGHELNSLLGKRRPGL